MTPTSTVHGTRTSERRSSSHETTDDVDLHDLVDTDRPCPNLDCLAPPNEYCRRPDGHLRRLPCIARMKRDNDTNTRIANELTTEPETRALRYDKSSGVRRFD